MMIPVLTGLRVRHPIAWCSPRHDRMHLRRRLIWNQGHLLHALREYERFYNLHRPHQGIANVRPLKPLPEPITDRDQLIRLNIHRRDRLGGVLHECEHAA
jgi:putative transposase